MSGGIGTVRLGDGLEVSAFGFGAMALAGNYGAIDDDAALATLHHALDAGVTLIDTADVYGAGRNEELVGRLLRERPGEATVATKVGILSEPDADGLKVRNDAAYLRAGIDASLGRLGVERVDLYYLHRLDPRIPIEDTIGELARLVGEGKVGHVGVSEVTGAELERAAAVHPIAAVQSEWSVWSRDVERHVVPAAARLGIGFVAYSPLGRGFLAAEVASVPEGDARRGFPRFDPDRLAANAPIGATVRRIAAAEGVTPAQLALAWLLRRAGALGVTAVPIPGTRRPERIDENLAALGIVLRDDVVVELDALAETVSGDRARDAVSISQGRERVAG